MSAVTPPIDASEGSEGPRPVAGSPLHERTLVVIEPTKAMASLDLNEIWAHRELLYLLVWRDLKVRYKQTALGIGWVVLQPLLMTIIFTVVLGRVVKIPTNSVPYPLFAYTGIMLWTFFSGAVSITGNCLVGNAPLITKIYFPRLLIPIASVVARLVDFVVVLVILLGLMLYYRIGITTNLLMAPYIILLVSVLSLGFGMWTSALNVKYRDVGIAMPVLIQLWMFASPVVYGLNLIPPKLQLAYSLNPLVGIIEGFRSSLFGGSFPWTAILISSGITLFLLVYGAYAFQSREKTFADII